MYNLADLNFVVDYLKNFLPTMGNYKIINFDTIFENGELFFIICAIDENSKK